MSKDEVEKAWDIVKRFDIPSDAKLIGINPGAAFGTAKSAPCSLATSGATEGREESFDWQAAQGVHCEDQQRGADGP